MLDERTEKYFSAIKKNVGFLGSNAGYDTIEEIIKKNGNLEKAQLKLVESYTGYVNSSQIEVYTYLRENKRRYCAQFSYRTHIDDYCIETLIFDRKPNKNDVMTIKKIHEMEFKFNFNRLEPEFYCWECGRKVHWLDGEGSLNEKSDRLEEKYCGC